MTEHCKRAALYLRISKLPKGSRSKLRDGDTSYSVEDQDDRCSELCETSGYKIVAKFYDDGVSAYRSLTDRPGYGDMKAALANGKFDVLVFDRQDRLARDESETMRFVADCKDAGIAWHSVLEQEIDLSQPYQRLSAIMRGGEAERYSASISRNQTKGNAAKRKAGLPGAGPRPFGYAKWNPKRPNGQPLREDEADLIRRGTEMILMGAPRYQVTKMFNASGIPTSTGKDWHSAKVGKLLSRWRNAGVVEFDGEPYGRAVWPAIVSEDDVRNVRTILSQGRAPGKWKVPTMLCSGIARCRCGYQLVATGSTVGPAYRCGELIAKPEADRSPGPHVTIAAHLLDPRVRDAVVESYFTRPASSRAERSQADSVARLHARREGFTADRKRAQEGYEAGIYSAPEAKVRVAEAELGIKSVGDEIEAAAAESAHAAMLNAVLAEMLAKAIERPGLNEEIQLNLNHPDAKQRETFTNAFVAGYWSWPEFVGEGSGERGAMRERLGEQFDALDLEAQRHLVRSLVKIRVDPGQGTKRVAIVPV